MKSKFGSRLRALREPFGTAGLIVAIVALVAALGGGAYAASGALTGKQKKEVEKIAKKYAGKNGKNGATGPTGPTGSTGPTGPTGSTGLQGAPGAAGDPGSAGAAGNPGASGESVEVNAYNGPECAGAEGEKGVELSNGTGTAYACNGAQGPAGPTSTELPAGATETGVWTTDRFEGVYPAEQQRMVLINFGLRLPEGESPPVKYMAFEATPTEFCPGSAKEPTAKEGFACVYASKKEEEIHIPVNGSGELSTVVTETSKNLKVAGRSGFGFNVFELEEAEGLPTEGSATFIGGTWAVTAKAATP
jgi:hypothetical protein